MPHFAHRFIQDPAHRMDASQILKHSFITDDLTLPNAQPSKITGALGIPNSEESEQIAGVCGPSPNPPWADAYDQNTNNQSRPMSTFVMHFNHIDRQRLILGNISNGNTEKPNNYNRSLPVRRVVSDPISFKLPYYREKSTKSDSTLKLDAPSTKKKSVLLSGLLPATYDIALPFQNSTTPDERPQLPMKPLKLNKNFHSFPPPVRHVHCYREIFFYQSSRSRPTIFLRCLLEQLAQSQ